MDECNIIGSEKDFEIAALRSELKKVTNELTKYRVLLDEVDSEANPNIVSDEEVICIQEIRKLKEASDHRQLSTDEAKRLDLFHKNLKLARGENTRVGSKNTAKGLTQTELENLAKG